MISTVNGSLVSDPRFEGVGLVELKTRCAELNIAVTEEEKRDKYALIRKIKEAEHNEEHREVAGYKYGYYSVAYVTLLLGCAALAVSLPHVAEALVVLTGCAAWVAYLLAGIIDFGIATSKAIDTLSHRFELRRLRPAVWTIMVLCLVLSAFLNSQQFLANLGKDAGVGLQGLAVFLAFFVSCFVFGTFYIGSNMLLRCEDYQDQEESEIGAAEYLRQQADEYEKIDREVARLKKRRQ